MTFCIVMEDPPIPQICSLLATLCNDNNWHMWRITWLFQHHYTHKSNICGLNKSILDWLTWSNFWAIQPPCTQLQQKEITTLLWPKSLNKLLIFVTGIFINLKTFNWCPKPRAKNIVVFIKQKDWRAAVNDCFVTMFPSWGRESSNFNLLYVWRPTSHLQDKWARKGWF